ncbi:CHAT domain-containing protein, partial [Coleofasciculus sp. LEGE 07081]|uniref:CHAT domain-containing protein n=1 Tax=Coleofasciculus sp. LEGE 07081 TaxID=2777967 RepID=UPI0018830575
MFLDRHRWYWFYFLLLTTVVFCLSIHPGSIVQAKESLTVLERQSIASVSPEQLVQSGMVSYQAGKFAEAIAQWEQVLPQITDAKDRAIVHGNLALAYRQIGQLPQAIAQWEEALELYRSQNDTASQKAVSGLLTEQAQAYSDLGQHQRAINLLKSAIEIARQNQNRLSEAAAQGVLGTAYWALGDYEQALVAQENSLKIARELKDASYIATALNNLGNIYVSQATRYRNQAQLAELEGDEPESTRLTQTALQAWTKARTFFEESVQTAGSVGGLTEVRALMNLNRWLVSGNSFAQETSNEELTSENWQRVRELLTQAPDSREKAYALINLAENFRSQESVEILEQALMVGRRIGDARAESFALGSLGQLQEIAGEYGKAMELTRHAQFAAQEIRASDSLYRWQWQAGRILKARGATADAITAYEQAIATLQGIRGDLVAANQDLQLDFREQVEPVYRELIELLLTSPTAEVNPQPSKVNSSTLKKVVDILELLKLAELENFFGDECVQVARSQAQGNEGLAAANAVVVYSVILNNRTEIIMRSPDGTMLNYPVAMNKSDIEAEIEQLRYLLELRTTEQYLPQVQKIYNLLIRPIEADLAAIDPDTLVFINDGVLRQVPMAALHDGQEFLIEKYPIAITPSLTLTGTQPLNRKQLKALSLGLTVEKPPFAALTNVKAELNAVGTILGGTELIDQEFTLSNLQAKLQARSYPIVHMATHGKFGVDSESTFLLGDDQRITLDELDNLLRSRGATEPVRLLTLSACQTAAGDNRSALGIAGVAVRAGVETAVATLWFINDEATVPLIEEFYRQLRQPEITKAESLRRAQLKMIADVNYNHPAVWSP